MLFMHSTFHPLRVGDENVCFAFGAFFLLTSVDFRGKTNI